MTAGYLFSMLPRSPSPAKAADAGVIPSEQDPSLRFAS
jgi:hypothetical protein